jgi:hypothetical protein
MLRGPRYFEELPERPKPPQTLRYTSGLTLKRKPQRDRPVVQLLRICLGLFILSAGIIWLQLIGDAGTMSWATISIGIISILVAIVILMT